VARLDKRPLKRGTETQDLGSQLFPGSVLGRAWKPEQANEQWSPVRDNSPGVWRSFP